MASTENSNRPPDAPEVCPNCGSTLRRNYCPECGQKALPEELSLWHFMESAADQLFGVDSRLRTTLRDFFIPGRYLSNWLERKRARYIAPLKFFLLCNLFYFLLLSLGGFNTLVTPYNNQLNMQVYSEWVHEPVTGLIAASGMQEETVAQAYDERVRSISNSLIILTVPMLALFSLLLNMGHSRRLYHHFTTGLYFAAWFLILSMGINVLGMGLSLADRVTGWNSSSLLGNLSASLLMAAVLLWICYGTFRRVYDRGRIAGLLKALAMALAAFPLVLLAYRLILLWITLLTVIWFQI